MPSIVLRGHQRDTFFADSMEDGPGNDRGSGHEETRELPPERHSPSCRCRCLATCLEELIAIECRA